MTLHIENIFKCMCIDNMSKGADSGDHSDRQQERLLDDSSSDESPDPELQTTEEERCGTVPGSTITTAIALAGARAQANPMVERSPPHRRKKSQVKKKTETVATQTPREKQTK